MSRDKHCAADVLGVIDFSDIPELDDEFWKHAKIIRAPQKPVVTMRVDAETVAFFKGEDPKGYTSRMAAVLRAYVRAQGGAGLGAAIKLANWKGLRGVLMLRHATFACHK